MPTVLRWEGYRFYFFSNEGYEPRLIHVDRAGNTAKFWLEPVSLARNVGFADRVLGTWKQEGADDCIVPNDFTQGTQE